MSMPNPRTAAERAVDPARMIVEFPKVIERALGKDFAEAVRQWGDAFARQQVEAFREKTLDLIQSASSRDLEEIAAAIRALPL